MSTRKAPSGWGVVVVSDHDEIIEELYGPVELNRDSLFYLRALVEAIIPLSSVLSDLLGSKAAVRKGTPQGNRITICYDSEYAAKTVMGVYNGYKNESLYMYCRDLLKEVKSQGYFSHGEGTCPLQ